MGKVFKERFFDDNLKAMSQVGSVKKVRRMGFVVFLFLLIGLPAVFFLPWLQTTSASGSVIAFEPSLRMSEVQAQVSGVVNELHAFEGQEVKEGDLILEIEDNDPLLMSRIESQLDSMRLNLQANEERREDLFEKLRQKKLYLEQAIDVEQNKIAAAKAEMDFYEMDLKRKKSLYEDGIVSQVKLQKVEADFLKSKNKFAESQSSLRKNRNDIKSQIADSSASVKKVSSEIAKLNKEITAFQSKKAKGKRLQVFAPQDGIVSSVKVSQGQYLKPGAIICTLIPDSKERFVEVKVDGNYAPLLRARKLNPDGSTKSHGSLVRLQFEGWPAIQFSGWPSAAVGTFGGEITFIDAQDDGTGYFRVIVAPITIDDAKASGEQPWPSRDWLRLGTRTKAWVQIQQVQLWEELWRRFNGFPPALPKANEPDKKQAKKGKAK